MPHGKRVCLQCALWRVLTNELLRQNHHRNQNGEHAHHPKHFLSLAAPLSCVHPTPLSHLQATADLPVAIDPFTFSRVDADEVWLLPLSTIILRSVHVPTGISSPSAWSRRVDTPRPGDALAGGARSLRPRRSAVPDGAPWAPCASLRGATTSRLLGEHRAQKGRRTQEVCVHLHSHQR